ncbi:aspartate/glutamate racemase family protein [Evansella halocellulosilytica]|uniref:aspartate/glutamate racemase family protein n=1 Tax=Evansella halocellulosilytica TaxID=2011013 RepID=UPI000BB76BE3|nr:aspartate/glutamate racemase family protein [Evansella halocellulosilytica]
MLGIIRVLTTEDQQILQEHSVIMDQEFGIGTVSRCIPDQWHGIYSQETEELAIPKIESLAKEMVEKDQVSAITVSCAADPGVQSCREIVDVPVYGAGEAGAYAALMVSDRVGVLGITQDVPKGIKNILGERLIAHKCPEGVTKTTDLLTESSVKKAILAAEQLVEQGASSILFACTGFSTIGLKRELKKHIDVPVIDLVQAQAVAYLLTK